ncbi:CHASE2 domain-containing protein [Xanthomonas sacchari]|uniref:CHASE2 domain-containing protein n=1 Tax=Xanthomonas sacchari TaxID=56458 RepID=UPI0020C444D1|nr:CHASE2 domain-containing protein [Xanthomonas sacchari]
MSAARPRRAAAVAAAAAAGLAAALSLSNATWRLDQALYDALIKHSPRPADPRLLLIAIDDRSLQALGQWPWRREVHARLLDRLTAAGSERVALDLLFSEPEQLHPDDDARLAAALRRNGRTVLPVIGSASDAEMTQELLPIPAITAAAAQLAHTEIAVDADGVSRGVYLRAGLGSAHWPALGAALVGQARPPAPASTRTPYAWHRADYAGLHFAAPSAPFAQVSYVDVLQGRIPAQALRQRLVIVGVSATGLGPRVTTPMSADGGMSAPEYQANVAATLLRADPILPLSRSTQVAVSALLTLLVCLGTSCAQRARRWHWLAPLTGMAAVAIGSLLWVLASGRWFAPGAALLALAIVAGFRLCLHAARWRQQAQRDALTGLLNRHGFEQAFGHELDEARRSGKPLTLIIVDVDHFKRYNDTLGHRAGDRALTLVANAVARHARRPHEVAARFGGDEFVMILPATDTADACRIAAALVEHIRGLSLRAANGSVAITASLGVHSASVAADTRERDFFELADTALYRAKRAGRDGYALSDDLPDHHTHASGTLPTPDPPTAAQ